MDEELTRLLNKIKSYQTKKGFQSKADLQLVAKAYQFAFQAHAGQKRFSGDPYFSHPLAVAQVLVDWKLDSVSIAAALLHDVVEETATSLLVLEKEFGQEVARLVEGVTKIGEIKLRASKEEKFIENLRKMIVVMAKDLRVVLIKLADRYHNLQSLYVLPKEKQVRIAKETLEVYAPLAERLGIGETKGQLEDLAFPYLYPQEHRWLKKYSAAHYKTIQKDLNRVKRKLLRELAEQGIKAEVHARAKHFYSLYKKLLRAEVNKDINKVYDLVALRIIPETVEQCYAALGVVHKACKPVPFLGVSDFIAQPKPNGYRSIHTKVFGPQGRIVEIQIRTKEMHEEAENGIAAHWHYGQLKAKGRGSKFLDEGRFAPTEKMAWVKELVKWQKEIADSQEFIKSLKFDALSERQFIFSPKGDVFDLPAGATPVDFAYAVHTDLGDKCGGAKVDGKMVPLNHRLKSGQMVEIIPQKGKKKPSRHWLDFVATRVAKQKIGRHFRKS